MLVDPVGHFDVMEFSLYWWVSTHRFDAEHFDNLQVVTNSSFNVSDVDALYTRSLALGLRLQNAPRDAAWGERYF